MSDTCWDFGDGWVEDEDFDDGEHFPEPLDQDELDDAYRSAGEFIDDTPCTPEQEEL